MKKNKEHIPPEKQKELELEALKKKFEDDCKKIEEEYQIRKRSEKKESNSEFDKMLGSILKVPKPDK